MHLLLVEDSDLVARAVVRVLRRDFEVLRADDGEAAREILAAPGAAFDLILSDVTMPRLDGLGLLRWIQTERPELLRRVLFMTADPLCRAAVEIGQAHEHPILTKPVTRAMIRQLIETIGRRV